MNKQVLLGALCLATMAVLAPAAQAANSNPVILVNGLAGFDRAEALGFKYWGGKNDLQAQLRNAYSGAQPVYTITVGGYSSNWDRALELYYQIKGGCVDYGATHSTNAGHARTGRCYTGVYPTWSATNPVHLIGHGMGGQTARMLAQLLAANGAPRNSGLFGTTAVSAAWVKSVSTIASPNDGSTLPDVIKDNVPYVQGYISRLARLAGGRNDLGDMVYDFRLDQFNIAQRATGESFGVYFDRVLRSSWWYNTGPDRASYDMSPKGAADMNAWVTTLPSVVYFSWSSRASLRNAVSGFHYPRGDTNNLLSQFCGPDAMGNTTRNQAGFPVIDSSWWESDCVVPTRSQKAPTIKLSGTSFIATGALINDISAGGTPKAGQWNFKGLKSGVDHLDILGWVPNPTFDALAFYKAHIDQLRAL
ncbi:MAG: hypothetical protein RL748_2334 [Pseudomonadota bacterium]